MQSLITLFQVIFVGGFLFLGFFFPNRLSLFGLFDNGFGFTLKDLPLKAGYYRPPGGESDDVRRCPDAALGCPDDLAECGKESNSGCVGSLVGYDNVTSAAAGHRLQSAEIAFANVSTEVGCRPGLYGTYCKLCAEHPERVYYSAATRQRAASCRFCYGMVVTSSMLALLVAGVLALAAAALRCIGRRLPEERQLQLSDAWRKFTPHNKLKIIVGTYLIVTKIDEVYEVSLPTEIKNLLGIFSVGVSFGFNGVSSVLECIGLRGYEATLALYIATPIVLSVLLLVVVALRLWCGSQLSVPVLFEACTPLLLKLFFIAYPLVTNVAFEAFSCYPFTSVEDGVEVVRGWLKADVQIECWTPDHSSAINLSILAICLYPIGVLATNMLLLFLARKAIQSGKCTPLSNSIAFLYREYEPEMFWWELIE